MNVRSWILASLTLAVSFSTAPGFAADATVPPTAVPPAATTAPTVRRQRGPSIETLLNLTPDQKTRYQAIQSQFRAKGVALRASTLPADQKAVQRKQWAADRNKAIQAILTPTQLAQYNKILADRAARREAAAKARPTTASASASATGGAAGAATGPGSRSPEAMIARLKDALNLTADQESKIRAILQSQAQERARLRQAAVPSATATDADRAKLRSEYASLRRETNSQIRAVLTPDQQAKFDAMTPARRSRTAVTRDAATTVPVGSTGSASK